MAVAAVTTYVCDRCGKTAPEEPPAEGEFGGPAPKGWNQLMLRDLRTMGQRGAEICDECTLVVMPDFWKANA